MKNMKKLLVSAFMLMIAFVALVTSTYAWFTNSEVATVSNIQISTVSADNLLVAYKDTTPEDSDFKTRIDLENIEGLELKNVSTIDLENWYTASADDPNSYEIGAENTYSQVNDTSDYVMSSSSVWIKYVGEDASKQLYLSDLRFEYPENVEPTHDDMLKCIRFGVLIGDDFYIYAKGTEATNNCGSDGTDRVEIENWQLVDAQNRTDYICVINQNVAVQATIFLWFEGEDTHCYQNNLDLNHIIVTFSFSIRNIA